MNELFNFTGSSILVQHNWIWMLASLLIGVWVGWITCTADGKA